MKGRENNMQERKIDKNIFTLGLVSLFTDISSQMIYPLLPVFLSSVLGVGTVFIGLLEGVAEGSASVLKVFSGWFSDKLKKRKPIIFLGYGLSTIGKPFLYLATAGWHVLIVRFIDRVGKGIRTSPRDALVADSSLPGQRGRAFGIQRAMDRTGAFLGPLIAFAILPALNNNLRLLFLLAFFPALIAVFIISFLREKPHNQDTLKQAEPISLKNLSRDFKFFIFIIAVFTLGNSSNAFLVLRAKDLGVKIVFIPILWLMYNLVSSISSIPLGHMSDKIGRKKTTLLGFFVYGAVYLGFAFSNSQGLIWFFMAIYGIYYGLSEGVLRAYVADMVDDKSVLASAYGVFHMVVGLCALPASLVMGILWQQLSPSVAFCFGASLSFVAAFLLFMLIKK